MDKTGKLLYGRIKMKVPPNMTEQQVIDEINSVVNKIAPKYTFYGYETEDINLD